MLSCYIVGSIFVLHRMFYWYLEEKNKMQLSCSENYDQVVARVIESEVGIFNSGYGKYQCSYFVPYIRYKYIYDNKSYSNNIYSYPTTYKYQSNIDVKKIIENFKKNPIVFVNRSDPNCSYIRIDDSEIKLEMNKLMDKYILASIPVVAVLITSICSMVNTFCCGY